MVLRGTAIVGGSIVAAALIFGIFFYAGKAQDKTIRVVGMSSKRISSDVAKWNIVLGRSTGLEVTQDDYALMKRDLDITLAYLESNGIQTKNVTVQPVNAQPNYGQKGITGYLLQQRISATSNDIPAMEKIALNPTQLSEQGVTIQSSNLEYFFSKLADIKMQLLSDATIDAKVRAQSIAQSSGMRIGRMISARAGVFQIREPYSTEVADYGIYNTSSKEKDAAVTMNAVFSLR